MEGRGKAWKERVLAFLTLPPCSVLIFFVLEGAEVVRRMTLDFRPG
jgi:hypothetical protein